MWVNRFTDAVAFLQHTESVLMEEELLNNLPLGVLYRLVEEERRPEPYFLASVDDEGGPVLMMLQTQKHLILSRSGAASDDKLNACCNLAVEFLYRQRDVHIPSIVGVRTVADIFAEVWKRVTGMDFETEMNQRVYGCTAVQPIQLSPGQLRLSTKEEAPLIAGWIEEFCVEALESISRKDAEQMAERGIERSAIYVWDDGEPVSMAQKTRPTRHGAVVNMVYTPRVNRGKGYASSCVAALTQSMLNGPDRFASLYTDLSNPVSNHMYMNIGYKPVADSVVYVFREPHLLK